MNTEYELQSKLLELKRFLGSISDISYSYQTLKNEARRNTVPLDLEVAKLQELAQQATQLLKAKGETYGNGS